nr:DNA gyrase inhibitor YacG [Neisseria meningitidis]
MTESRQTRLQVKCPTCQTAVVWKPENAFRPFCSQRCKLIDLGGWADGKYPNPTWHTADRPAFPANTLKVKCRLKQTRFRRHFHSQT